MSNASLSLLCEVAMSPGGFDYFAGRTDVDQGALEFTRAKMQRNLVLGFTSYLLEGEGATDQNIQELLGDSHQFSGEVLVPLIAELTKQTENATSSMLSREIQGNLFFTADYAVVVTFLSPADGQTRGSWTIAEQWPNPDQHRNPGTYVFRPLRARP